MSLCILCNILARKEICKSSALVYVKSRSTKVSLIDICRSEWPISPWTSNTRTITNLLYHSCATMNGCYLCKQWTKLNCLVKHTLNVLVFPFIEMEFKNRQKWNPVGWIMVFLLFKEYSNI